MEPDNLTNFFKTILVYTALYIPALVKFIEKTRFNETLSISEHILPVPWVSWPFDLSKFPCKGLFFMFFQKSRDELIWTAMGLYVPKGAKRIDECKQQALHYMYL